MKMLFLDTVVIPVLSQMMRGKEILARACCCFMLNTFLFSHQNLHGSTHDVGPEALLEWEGITWPEMLPECKRTTADTYLQHKRAPGPQAARGFQTSGAPLTAQSKAQLPRCPIPKASRAPLTLDRKLDPHSLTKPVP